MTRTILLVQVSSIGHSHGHVACWRVPNVLGVRRFSWCQVPHTCALRYPREPRASELAQASFKLKVRSTLCALACSVPTVV